MKTKKSRTNDLAKNTILLGLNKFVSPFVSFLLVPIYTNNISSYEYGIADLIQTYVALLVPILLMRLDVGMFRFLVERRGNKKAISEVATNVLALSAPTTILASILMIIAIAFNVLPFQAVTLFYFLNVMINNVITPLVRGLGKNSLYAVASIVNIVLNLIFSIVFVLVLQMGGLGLILSLALSYLMSSIVCLVGIRTHVSFSKKFLNKSLRKELVKLSLPIVADGVSFWVINTSDRTVISIVIGAAANGVYAISNKFSNLIGTMTSIFWMSWSEQASIALKDKNYSEFVSKIFDVYLRISSSISMILIAAVPVLFKLLVNENYDEAMIYVPALIIGLLLNSLATFYGPIYLAFKKSKEVAISTSVAAIINLLVDVLLINFVGIWAAVISTIVAYLFILIYRYVDVKKLVKIKYNIWTIVMVLFFMAICIVLYYINIPVLTYINIAFATIIAIVLNRKIIGKFLKPVFGKLGLRKRN